MFERKEVRRMKFEMGLLNKRISNLERPIKDSGTIWLTGLPCSGKTTIARRLEYVLKKRGHHIAHLDGDDVRMGLNSDLGFSKKDRQENLRRIGYVAQLFNDKGITVLASFVSPLEENRAALKSVIQNFNLAFVKCSVERCSKRDVKGMYKLAKEGKIKNFTGISAPFEIPANPEIILDTENLTVDECVRQIIEKYF